MREKVTSPFLADTDYPLVALQGKRAGYIQLAPSAELNSYADLPDEMLFAAKAWTISLENLGARRIYWITLSEAVRHLHIHLYPRWDEQEARGLPLFEQREQLPQPDWLEIHSAALRDWCRRYRVYLIN